MKIFFKILLLTSITFLCLSFFFPSVVGCGQAVRLQKVIVLDAESGNQINNYDISLASKRMTFESKTSEFSYRRVLGYSRYSKLFYSRKSIYVGPETISVFAPGYENFNISFPEQGYSWYFIAYDLEPITIKLYRTP